MLPPARDRNDLELEGVRYGVSAGDGNVYAASSSMAPATLNRCV